MAEIQPSLSQAEIDQLRDCCITMASRLEQLKAQLGQSEKLTPGAAFSDAKLATIAAAIYRSRRRRLKHFDGSLFAEPAWDMLLEMFVKTARAERISTINLCVAADIPASTGLRWIIRLEDQGHLRRYKAPDDARLMLIEMSPGAYERMREFLSEGIVKFGMQD